MEPLHSGQGLEKTNRQTERQTVDRQTALNIGRQTDQKTDEPADCGHNDRWTEDRHTHLKNDRPEDKQI